MKELATQAVVKIFGMPVITIDEWAETKTLSEQNVAQEKPKKFNELFPKAINAESEG